MHPVVSVSAWTALRRPPWKLLASSLPWRSGAYLITTVLIGLVGLAPLMVTWFAAPLWAISLARLERLRVVVLGAAPIPEPPTGTAGARVGRLARRLREPVTWREVAYLAVFVVFTAMSFVLIVTGATAVMVGATTVLGIQPDAENLVAQSVASLGAPAGVVVSLVIIVLLVLSYLTTALALLQSFVAQVLLSEQSEALARRVSDLTYSRRTLLEGFDIERRRIERDLHDGAQQQLVTLGLRLALLEIELDDLAGHGSDVSAARRALSAAQDDVDAAVTSLRDSIRAIHPRVLVDHGIAAAVHELASRLPVPVTVDINLPQRPDSNLEAALYFITSEALTNAVRHAKAHDVTVRGGQEGSSLWLDIIDDGIGGADTRKGTGLAGLRDRAEVLGGQLTLRSPLGGPTVLHLSIPVPANPDLTERTTPDTGSDSNSA
jgi:signal transduction histidine kinase